MNSLKRIEDLTSRYASARIGAAGLGPLWACILVAILMTLIWNYINAEYAASTEHYSSLWGFLDADTLSTPFWIKAAAISVSILTWLGVTCLQILIDRRFGVAMPKDPTEKIMRFLMPGMFIFFMLCSVGYNLGQSLAISDNNAESVAMVTDKYYGKSLLEIMDIGSYLGWAIITTWGVIWAFSTRDGSSRALAGTLTVMLFPIMSSTLNDRDIVAVVPLLILLIVSAILGLIQFVAFLKVRRELDALSVSE
jgi:hypothetical protein